MKRVSSLELTPGMVLAEDVFNFNNQLILNKGTILTDRYITQLEILGIPEFRVEDEHTVTPFVSQFEETPSYSDRVKQSPEFIEFKENYDIRLDKLKNQLSKFVHGDCKLDVQKLLDDTLQLLNTKNGTIHVFDMLHNMRQYDDATFSHCINVSLICNVFARWLEWSPEETELITACGLLHDIGKLLIPINILQKPATLTVAEYEIIKKHTVEGYRILHDNNVDMHICNAALMHHEKCDGSGYPFGIKGSKIDKYAKVVCIADVYDALTAARVYRGPLCPFTAIEEFEKDGIMKYDPAYLFPFLENIVNTYILHRCRLTNGQEGDIIFINKRHLSRPTVKCGDEYVDLSSREDLSIKCLL